MIRAILFDVDGVLIDSFAANSAFYRSFLATHGYTALTDAEVARGHTLTLYEAIAVMTRAPEERVREIWQEARSLPGYPFDLLHLPEGSEAVIRSLSREYSLGIVTSRIVEGVDHFYAFSGLGPYFDTAVTFDDYTHPKPHPEPLIVACSRLSVEPAEAIYVGDAPTDLLCAEAAGAEFIAFGDAIPHARHIAKSFAEIEQLVGKIAGV